VNNVCLEKHFCLAPHPLRYDRNLAAKKALQRVVKFAGVFRLLLASDQFWLGFVPRWKFSSCRMSRHKIFFTNLCDIILTFLIEKSADLTLNFTHTISNQTSTDLVFIALALSPRLIVAEDIRRLILT